MIVQMQKGQFTLTSKSVEVDKIPLGTYNIKYDDIGGFFYIQERLELSNPSNLIEINPDYTERIIGKFKAQDKNLGVVFHGEKGTGKTIDAKKLCINSEFPVLCLDAPYKGTKFKEFLQGISQKFILFIDEFDKIYSAIEGDNNSVNHLLSIMDGSLNNSILFVLTSNKNYLGAYLENRPGRVYFKIGYEGLTIDQIRFIGETYLKDKSKLDNLVRCCMILSFVSIDMLLCIIEELNHTGYECEDILKYLNISNTSTNYYDVYMIKDNKELLIEESQVSPFRKIFDEEYVKVIYKDEKIPEVFKPYIEDNEIVITLTNIWKPDVITENQFIYKEDDYTIVMKKIPVIKNIY